MAGFSFRGTLKMKRIIYLLLLLSICFLGGNAQGIMMPGPGTVHSVVLAAPIPIAVGVADETHGVTGAVPTIPAGTVANDVMVMFVATRDEAITVSGWTEAPSSPSSQPGGMFGNHRLTVFWKRAVGSDPAPTTSATASGQLAQILSVRGCTTSGNPFDATSSSQTTNSSLTATIPGVTTTVPNTLVLYSLNIYPGSTSDFNGWFSGWTNAGLTSVTEWMDRTKQVGGFGMASGGWATTGAAGNMTVTVANNMDKAYWAGALKP